MKTKGVTIWEQRAEKIVLAIAVVAFVVLAGRQFIGEPNAVEISGGETIAPGEVDDLLRDVAER